MVKSMTGFGKSRAEKDGLAVTVEIKSVNHRYFEFSSRLPRGCMFLDEKLKGFFKDKIARGKVEVAVTVEDNSEKSAVVEINRGYADAYIAALKQLSVEYHLKNDIKLSSLADNNDLFTIKSAARPDEEIAEVALCAAADAFDGFKAMREKEGERLLNDVKTRAEYILTQVDFIDARSPETVNAYRQRLEEKIRELIGDTSIDEQRLLTETAIFADKVAVAEETVRLKSHIAQLTELLYSDAPAGRKLDFIVQEMNRETNTIGSKAQDIEITRTVVEIKSEIEKIREQIQNIE